MNTFCLIAEILNTYTIVEILFLSYFWNFRLYEYIQSLHKKPQIIPSVRVFLSKYRKDIVFFYAKKTSYRGTLQKILCQILVYSSTNLNGLTDFEKFPVLFNLIKVIIKDTTKGTVQDVTDKILEKDK